jgi:hypothetical protein
LPKSATSKIQRSKRRRGAPALVPMRATASGLKWRLGRLSAGERERMLLDLVRSTAATVLSTSRDRGGPHRHFVVEFPRKRLNTGSAPYWLQ